MGATPRLLGVQVGWEGPLCLRGNPDAWGEMMIQLGVPVGAWVQTP